MPNRELPRASAERIRAVIKKAESSLFLQTKWLPTELVDGKKTCEEVESILCQVSKEWAWEVFVAILSEWCEIGIPPEDFEAIAKNQVENLSTRAEDRLKAMIDLFDLSPRKVWKAVHDLLPGLIPPYRDENRFRFASLARSSYNRIQPLGAKRFSPVAKDTAGQTGEESDRRAKVDAYIDEVLERMHRRITRTDIWKLAKYKSRTEFERWESFWYEKHGRKPNRAANQRFTRILSEKPHLK